MQNLTKHYYTSLKLQELYFCQAIVFFHTIIYNAKNYIGIQNKLM